MKHDLTSATLFNSKRSLIIAHTYVFTAAAGNICCQITEKLLAEGHNVRAIARAAEKLQDSVDKGAESHTGSMEDTAF